MQCGEPDECSTLPDLQPLPKGLAILPVVPTVAPNSLRDSSAEFKALDRRYTASNLKTHWLVLRTLPVGYLYVLKPDLTWDIYLVDVGGLLHKTPAPLSQPDGMSIVEEPAAPFIVLDPTKTASVWLAFSHYAWTDKVRSDYAANKDDRRNDRMTKLDVMAAAAGSLGSTHPAQNAVKFGVPMGPDVRTVVADYASVATTSALNEHLATPVRDLHDQGEDLARRMAAVSSETQGKTGAVIAIPDDLGLAMELNALRNAEVGRMGAYLAQHQRERTVGDIILGFTKTFEDNGDGETWSTKYKKHYDHTKVVSDKQTYDKRTAEWNQRIVDVSNDVATLNGRQSLWGVWRDFDPTDDQSARDRQDATARRLHGAVKTPEEQTLWDQWFEEDPSDPYSTVWGALTALEPTFGEFMLGKSLPDTGKTDKIVDVAKNLREVANLFREALARRAADDAMALLGSTMASQITRLQSVNPDLYKVAGVRILMVISGRTNTLVSPCYLPLNGVLEIQMLAEATFGTPMPSIKRLLDVEALSSSRVYIVGTNGVDLFTAPGEVVSHTRVSVRELWLPDEIAREFLALPPATPVLALPAPPVNPYQGMVRFTKSLPGAFAWVGFTLQAINLGNSMKSLVESGEDDKSDVYFSIVSGIFGVLGATAEITAGTMSKMAGRFATRTVARIALLGGVLSSASALVEGVQAIMKGSERASVGDYDAAASYRFAGAALLVSGLAGLGGALAFASGAGALTGTIAFLAPVGAAAASVPVAGWIVAGVIFLGIGIAFLWRAIRDTDDPLEEWLQGSVYGHGPVRFSTKDEMARLNDVLYAMLIEVKWDDDSWEWRDSAFYDDFDSFRFSISLPGANEESVIECTVRIIGDSGSRQVFHETIRPRGVGDHLMDPHVATLSRAAPRGSVTNPTFIWWESPAIRLEESGLRYGGKLLLDDSIYDKAEVEIAYWPNPRTMPNFVLPKESDKRTLVDSD